MFKNITLHTYKKDKFKNDWIWLSHTSRERLLQNVAWHSDAEFGVSKLALCLNVDHATDTVKKL